MGTQPFTLCKNAPPTYLYLLKKYSNELQNLFH